MKDRFDREIDYLRISVTDRCNLRCCYCMPEEGIERMRHEDILTYQEIVRVCQAGASLGIRRVKITGGEPLVRKGVEELVREIAQTEGIEDVTITTNGCLLGGMAKTLKAAGLSSVNVSLDTLSPVRFAEITRRDVFSQVMDGIRAAKEAGLAVKLNCAVMESFHQEDAKAFAEYSVQNKIPVRFIEMMPVGQGRFYKTMDNEEIAAALSQSYRDFARSGKRLGNGPAIYYTFDEGKGCVGFISAVHHKFCGQCNRVRLTSDGFLKLCLDSGEGVDLRTPLREGIAKEELEGIMRQWIRKKPKSHRFGEIRENSLNMNRIGG